MMSPQQKEKVKIPFDMEKIKDDDKEKFERELEMLLSTNENDNTWKKSAKSEYWNIPASAVKMGLPIFFGIFMSHISLNASKDVVVTLEGHEFTYNDEYKTIGRLKPGTGFKKSDYKVYPLGELFFGTIEQCNEKIREDSKSSWYFVDQHIHMQESYGVCFATIKKNKSTMNN